MHQFAETLPVRFDFAQYTDGKIHGLLQHRYFEACREKRFSRAQVVEIVKNLYCFSVYFERVITRRIADYRSQSDGHVLRVARQHLQEEIGHAELFRTCLVSNGMSHEEVDALAPKTFTKAMFGYLMATVAYDNEYTANIVIMQVMETIAFHFFGATLQVMRDHQLSDTAFVAHSEDDEHHAKMGLELYHGMSPAQTSEAVRAIDDSFTLMGHVFTEWMGETVR